MINLTKREQETIKKNLQVSLYRTFVIELKESIRQLVNDVKWALKVNPHNTFTDTPQEYIRQYGLARELHWKLRKHYTL